VKYHLSTKPKNHKMNPKDEFPVVEPDNGETFKDPKTGKTISRKRAYVMAGASVAAGSFLNEIISDPGIAEIMLDKDGDGVGDDVLTDTNNDGVYEISPEPQQDTVPSESPAQQVWNPNTAPVAGQGVVDDKMSFTDAFSSAREELGAGGVFAWHGQYYNTFYAEELDDNNQPVVEYEVTGQHDLAPIDYNDSGIPEEEPVAQEVQDEDSASSPNVMAADFDQDGNADAVYVDLNQDGSADAVYADLNQDGQIGEDEVVAIHDPADLDIPEIPSDGSMISVDNNADGVDEILVADVDGDQFADAVGIDENNNQQIEDSEITVLNPDALEGAETEEAPVEYSGEISPDMPEDVSDEVLDGMTDDLAKLEDNFDEINNWS
jgi:hypothetical protein